MKKFLLTTVTICVIFFNLCNLCFAQCTPDPGCIDDPEEPGELCPDSLPDGTVGEPYFEVVTIIPPYEGDIGAGTVDVIKIIIDTIENVPLGLTYEANAIEMFPYNSYCILISGTPTAVGSYQLIIKVTPWIEIFGVPVEGPQQVDDSSMAITINCPSPIYFTEVTAISCNGENDGSATVIYANGTPPFTYIWDDASSQTTVTATNLAPGIYNVTITDYYSCTITETVEIGEPDEITITSTTTNVSTYEGSDGAIDISVTGGTPPYNYLWDDTANTTTEDLTDIVFGWYSVTVTDTNLCTAIHSVYIAQPNDSLCPIITTINITDVSCNGGNDGSATVTPSNGAPPYTFEWSTTPTQSDSTVTALSEGTYTVTVYDDSCSVIEIVEIIQPTQILMSVDSITNVSSPGADDGAIYITVSGGISPYTFLWEGDYTDEDIDSLTNGTYWVQVTDSNGCIVSYTGIMVYITSINEISNSDIINIYPNPTSGELYITNAKNATIYIYNILGKVVIYIDNADTFNTIDISSLAEGAYYIKILTDERIITKKICLVK